jgi:hypothetical protein
MVSLMNSLVNWKGEISEGETSSNGSMNYRPIIFSLLPVLPQAFLNLLKAKTKDIPVTGHGGP